MKDLGPVWTSKYVRTEYYVPLLWNTQTANQAVGTGGIIGLTDIWSWDFGPAVNEALEFYWRQLNRAKQSAKIGFGAC